MGKSYRNICHSLILNRKMRNCFARRHIYVRAIKTFSAIRRPKMDIWAIMVDPGSQ